MWGHGTPHLHKIVDIIDQHPDVDVLYIKRKDVSDLEKFIQDIYAEEWPHVPKEHTLSKTRFLYHVPRDVALILVKNRNPKVRIQENKNPLFRMPESETIKDIKNLVRKQYDPNKGGRNKIQIVSGFNPDQHVLHASDFPEQIQNALNIFEMEDVSYWLEYWEKKYNPHQIIRERNNNIKDVLIDDIRMRILNENGAIYSSKVEKQGSLYYTVDGDHRLAILKSRGEKTVKVEVINE